MVVPLGVCKIFPPSVSGIIGIIIFVCLTFCLFNNSCAGDSGGFLFCIFFYGDFIF